MKFNTKLKSVEDLKKRKRELEAQLQRLKDEAVTKDQQFSKEVNDLNTQIEVLRTKKQENVPVDVCSSAVFR